MSVFVEFTVSGPPISLPAVAAEHPDVTFEIEHWRQEEGLVHWFIWAEGEDLEGVTASFSDVPATREVTLIDDGGSLWLYRVTVEPTVEPPSDELLREGAVTAAYLEPDGIRVAATVSCRDILTQVFQHLRSNDLSVSVDQLRYRPPDADDADLSEKQFEALTTAHEMGYFDDATCVTQREVADELGISRSAFSERLRRAERQLVERHIAGAR